METMAFVHTASVDAQGNLAYRGADTRGHSARTLKDLVARVEPAAGELIRITTADGGIVVMRLA